jgi:SAM-dependent methyltransferase
LTKVFWHDLKGIPVGNGIWIFRFGLRPNVALKPNTFLQEYTSPDATAKYTRSTAGFGISYLLDHDYKSVYIQAFELLPPATRQRGIRMLEFGCGGGMNLLHLVSALGREGIKISKAIGADFSPVLIEAAREEAKNYLPDEEQRRVEFYVAKNETLVEDLSSELGKGKLQLENSFDFILGVNTIRYCHRTNNELNCAQAIFHLLGPGGICVVIDMNNQFPFFRSLWRDRLRMHKPDKQECYLPSLQAYVAPFAATGFEVLREDHFCWIPHSSGEFMCRALSWLSPFFDTVAPSRAMRSLVVSRKPAAKAR